MSLNEPKSPAPAARAAPPELAQTDAEALEHLRRVAFLRPGTTGPEIEMHLRGIIDAYQRERDEARAEAGKLREERDAAQRAKYGTPCSCETWIETCRQAEASAARLRERVGELETALQRIRILATNGNPCAPANAAIAFGNIHDVARAALRAESPQDDTAIYYLADGSEVRLPREEVERRRKAAAKVIGAARDLVRERRRTGGAGGHDLRALAEALEALGEDAGKWSDVAAGLLACVSGPATPTPTTPPHACVKFTGFRERPTVIWLADGTKVRVVRDGKAAWLEVAPAEIVRPAAPSPEAKPPALTKTEQAALGEWLATPQDRDEPYQGAEAKPPATTRGRCPCGCGSMTWCGLPKPAAPAPADPATPEKSEP